MLVVTLPVVFRFWLFFLVGLLLVALVVDLVFLESVHHEGLGEGVPASGIEPYLEELVGWGRFYGLGGQVDEKGADLLDGFALVFCCGKVPDLLLYLADVINHLLKSFYFFWSVNFKFLCICDLIFYKFIRVFLVENCFQLSVAFLLKSDTPFLLSEIPQFFGQDWSLGRQI